jgi:PelA/Pel-15E family pectate lyase
MRSLKLTTFLKQGWALSLLLSVSCAAQKSHTATSAQTDTTAEKMLIYQRSVGGWPKAVAGGKKVDYHKVLTEADRKAAVETGPKSDATIDNNATTREINYLVEAYNNTKNKTYLQSAEKGIRYLLKAQNANGGWPQYYPDSSLYRAQITYNDNAMINAMNVLYNVANRTKGFDAVDASLVGPSATAIEKGLQCIIKTQVKVGGKLTAWCQQYDRHTLQPAVARKFELIGLSTSESVAIVEYMIRLKNPSADVIASIKAAMQWFEAVQIKGYRFDHIDAPSQPTKKDAVLVADPSSVIWSRYYEIGNNKPFFSGRDSEKKYNLTEIENERRAGYAWYGTWPKKLIEKAYPEWLKKNNLN